MAFGKTLELRKLTRTLDDQQPFIPGLRGYVHIFPALYYAEGNRVFRRKYRKQLAAIKQAVEETDDNSDV